MLYLFFIIPLASAQISIDIHPCTETSDTIIDISGKYERNTIESDLKFSELTEENIKDVMVGAGYCRPSRIYLFESEYYGIQPLTTVTSPVKVTILSTEEEIVTLAKKELHNTSPYAVTTKNELDVQKAVSINTTWSQNATLPFARNIKMHTNPDLQLTSDGNYHQYAHNSTTTKSYSEFVMGNEEKARVALRATEVRVKVQIEYKACITGQVYYVYYFFVRIWSDTIDILSEEVCLPFYETLDLKYYYDDRVDIEDLMRTDFNERSQM